MDIAITGMAVRFPGAGNLQEFADNLGAGQDMVREISAKRRNATGLRPDGNYQVLAHLEDIDLFDPSFFGISKAEAITMSPHQRIMMELAYEMFENAGYNVDDFSGSNTSVYMGDTQIEYYELARQIEPTLFTGNINSIIASRISRYFNLRGKALMIDTTCSSSLVALHLACRDLAAGESDCAVVGGVNLILFPSHKNTVDHLGILSPDGRARAFSAQANGTGTGEGAVCLLLKPLAKALADHDVIHAVIKGSAANQDANLSGSLTAPSSAAQAEVILRAWEDAGIEPLHVSYIEAHGTGTKLGDPIEIEGIDQAFRQHTERIGFCAVSTVKSNIGHTDCVAGLAGLVKAVLSLREQRLFPSLHFKEPNPYIDFAHSAVFINDALKPWPRNGHPRIAGISSFGMTGTNCHVVVEEAPAPADPVTPSQQLRLIALSAKTEVSLDAARQALLQHIAANPKLRIEDISYTLLNGRKHHEQRFAVAVPSLTALEHALRTKSDLTTAAKNDTATGNVFILSDWQTSDPALTEACLTESLFREPYEQCLALVSPDRRTTAFDQFAFQYSLYKFLEKLDIRPATVIADDLGKQVVAAATGRISLGEALATDHRPVARLDFEQRCRQIADRFIGNKVNFIEVGPLAGITRQLASWHSDGSTYKTLSLAAGDAPLLQFAGMLYLLGVPISFHRMFRQSSAKRVQLPAYRFNRERFWLEQTHPFGKVAEWCYEMAWMPDDGGERSPEAIPQNILLVAAAGDKQAATLKDELIQTGRHCMMHDPGEDLSSIRVRLDSMGIRIGCVIFIAAGNSSISPSSDGIEAHSRVVRAFHGVMTERSARWIAVTSGAQKVTTGERGDPSQAMHAAMLKGLQVDHLGLSVRSIDLDPAVSGYAKTVLHELQQTAELQHCAYRQGIRYVPVLQKLPPQPVQLNGWLPANGVYLVTGGATGIGKEICRSIAARNPAIFIIIGRTALPYRAKWEQLTGDPHADPALMGRIQGLLELEQAGSRVEYHSADIGNAADVRRVTEAIKQRYAQIHGVIHCAGASIENIPFDQLDAQAFRRMLSPKVEGTLNLDEYTRELRPSFFAMFSSLNAWVPKPHSTAYAIANSFEDAYAAWRQGGGKILSINWPGWDLSPGLQQGADRGGTGIAQSVGGLRPVSIADGVAAFYYALQSGYANIAFADMDLSGFRNNPFFRIQGVTPNAHSDTTTEKAIATPVVTLTSTEDTVLQIWRAVLKTDSISVDDDFFEAGGHSLLGIQVVNRIEKELGIAIEFEVFFDYFTVRTLAAYLDSLLSVGQATGFERILPIEEQEYYDVSYAQKRIWVVDQLAGSSVYNIPVTYVLTGMLNKEALDMAFDTLIRRHDSLRTILLIKDGVPRQRVLDADMPAFRIRHADLRESPDRYAVAARMVEDASGLRFDLYQGPVITASLIRLETDKCYFSFTLHHIVSDGWSSGIITRELIAAYNAFNRTGKIAIAPLPVQYKDYTAWQRRLMQAEEFAVHRNYWLQQFAGEVPVLNLPADYPRPAVQTFEGHTHEVIFEGELLEKIRRLAGSKDLTNFMILFSVVNMLLYKYVRQEEIVVGTPVTERGHFDLEDQIGFYVNNLPLKTSVKEQETFDSLLDQVRTTIVNANKHKEYPLELLLNELNLVRDTSRFPLFDVVAHYQNTSSAGDELRMDGITVSDYNRDSDITKFDILFDFFESENDIVLKLIYNSSLYSSLFISSVGRHFRTLLQAALQTPSEHIGALPILTQEERHYILTAFNDTASGYPRGESVVSLFERQAALTPEKSAILYEGGDLSYAELDLRSNRLANYLLSSGIAAGEKIGLLSARTPGMLVAMLGILKAGCAYVPFNLAYPARRLEYIRQDCGITHIVCTDDELPGRMGIDPSHCMRLADTARAGDLPAGIRPAPDSCAYVMYTSGTTGNPKGIAVSHRNVVKLACDSGPIAIVPEDRVLQWSNYAFDGSVYEIYGALLKGAAVGLIRDAWASDVYALSSAIESRGITVCFVTTALFNAFADLRPATLAGLRKILFGGELVSRRHVEKALAAAGPGRIIHVYGPTETTVYATAYPVDGLRADKAVPIGMPLSDTTAFVLDADMRPVPTGIPGELYIGGDGVAQGYINNPALSSDKFVPDTFGSSPGARLYRSGDIVRRLADGNIEFIGRVDEQVKVRGYRIEPGEIETALLACTGILQATIQVRDRGAGDKVLVAYYTAGIELDPADLHASLEKEIPSFMIPSRFIRIDAIPLTANGKIDRKLLPDIGEDLANAMRDVVAPRNETERRICAIWEKYLGLAVPGTEDNFFFIGGHSLNALKIISEIHRQFHVRLELRDVFMHPTVSAMAALIKNRSISSFTSIPVVEEQDHYAVSYAQRGLWIQHQYDETLPAYNISGAYIFEGSLKIELLEEAFGLLVRRHQILRTTFAEINGEPRQKIVDATDFPFRLHYSDLRNEDRQDDAITVVAEQEALQPFSLDELPLLRARLLQLAETKFIFFFTIHHIIADGWSLELFVHEVITSYNRLRRGEGAHAAPLRIHYKDFTSWQRISTTQENDTAGAYWLKKMASPVAPLDLPLDFPRTARKTFNSDAIRVLFDRETVDDIRAFCHANDLTLYAFFVANVKLLLYSYSGQTDLAIGMADSGRHHGDLEEQIGYYLNMLVLRSELNETGSLLDFCRQEKTAVLEAIQHNGYPFELLVARIGGKRNMARTPFFDVEVAYTNFNKVIADRASTLDEVKISLLNMDIKTGGKFDLDFLFLQEDELELLLFFNTDLFKKDTVAAMTGLLSRIMRQTIDTPHTRPAELREQLTIPQDDIPNKKEAATFRSERLARLRK